MPAQIHLDGTHLEGGGQLLRVALALSSLTSQPLKITNIRGKRHGGGGLKLQHLTCVQWLARASGAPSRGAEKKSKDLEFWSKNDDSHSLKLRRGGWGEMARVIDIGSPGAVGLVFQAILPYVLFSGRGEEVVYLTIKGGTNVSNSCSVDYMKEVLVPMLEKIGVHVKVRVGSRGWSTGRMEMGSVAFEVTPLRSGECLPAFQLEDKGSVDTIRAVMLGSRDSEKGLRRVLEEQMGIVFPDIPFEVDFEFSGHEKRLYVLLVAHTSTGMRLGRDHLLQERISGLDNAITKTVSRAVEDLRVELEHGGCVDEYLRDQFIVFQALAKGKSTVYCGREKDGTLVAASLHAQTAQWVVGEVLGADLDSEGVGWVIGESWASRRRSIRDDEQQRDLIDDMKELELTEG